MMRLPPGTPLQHHASRMSSGLISRRWLILARSAWIVCAGLLLANFVASIPAYYHLLSAVCALADQGQCTNNSGQLAPATVQLLVHLHLSLSGYAAFFTTVDVLVSLLAWGVGLLLFWRKSAEPMGLLVSLLFVFYGATGSYNTLLGGWAPAHPSPLLATLLELLSGAQWIGLGAFLLTFPTGQFVPRWSWLVFFCWIISFVSGLTPFVFLGVTGFLAVGGTLGIIVYRYLRVFTALQRQQAKWFIYAAVLGLTLFTVSSTFSGFVPADSPFQLIFPALTTVVPSAFMYLGLGFAMLRYRLWDIDRIINRTLVYGSLTTLLALLYVGLIVAFQALFQGVFNQTSDVAIVVSTLVIAALFQPLRHRLQQIIDQRFYRRKYNAARTLSDFSATLRSEVDLATLSEHLVAVVQDTMQPSHISLWVRQPGRIGIPASQIGEPAPQETRGRDESTGHDV